MNFARNKRKWIIGYTASILLLSITIYMGIKSSHTGKKPFDKKHETKLRQDYHLPSECALESEGEIRGEDGYRYSEYYRWSCKTSKKSFADRLTKLFTGSGGEIYSHSFDEYRNIRLAQIPPNLINEWTPADKTIVLSYGLSQFSFYYFIADAPEGCKVEITISSNPY